MKIAFLQHLGVSKSNKIKLEKVNAIIENYVAKGYRLTLRQLYYQLVKDNIIANDDKEYAKLSDLLVKGRMCGIVDWEAIVDRNRTPQLPYNYENPDEALIDLGNTYRIDRQEGQDNYVELWVEKDALSEVLSRKSVHYHVNLMVNRGYTSCTAVYESANRFRRAIKNGKSANIIYVGDHDPSGLDMVRDINTRLETFGLKEPVNVQHIALTMPQVQLYDLPENPAKIKDPRAGWYIKNFGEMSWEVDALTPEVLHETIDLHIEKLINMEKFNEIVERERTERNQIKILPELITDLRAWYKEIQDDRSRILNKIEDETLEDLSSLSDDERLDLGILDQQIEEFGEKIRHITEL